MADNNKNDDNQKPNDPPVRKQFPIADPDGDLGFAADCDAPLPKKPKQDNSLGLDRPFIPLDSAANTDKTSSSDEHASADPADEVSMGDTWVPEDGADDVHKTWVMPVEPTAADTSSAEAGRASDTDESSSTDNDSNTENDPNSTWVPSSTPTFDGSGLSAEEAAEDSSDADEQDPGRTWVPSSTPTFDGSEQSEADDPNKTWVPSSTPTADGIDSPGNADAYDVDEAGGDVGKTWVPSATPTHHDFSFDVADQPDAEADDPNKTWVPSGTPTADGFDGPVNTDIDDEGDDDADIGSDTVVLPDPAPSTKTATGTVVMDSHNSNAVDPSDSANAGTVVVEMSVAASVFSQTIGMKNLADDEDDEWSKNAKDAAAGDTAVLDLPDEPAQTNSSRRTQIWSVQSSDGLGSALTIRNAPVSGDSSFEDSMTSDQPDYQIIKKLAEGGMGAIYVAKQTSLGRELAIKTLKPLAENQRKTYQAQGRISQVQKQRREMFLSEALVTGNLVHPHIIPIHDLCQTGDGSPFYSMKRVHGTPWNESIVDLPLDENLEILMKVCDAMAYAHHNGVVNRDLKPENVMLGEFGEVLVLDWGLAVPATKEHKGKFASPAAPFGAGTPAYMSPELWSGPGEAIGVWSDIYLLGAILFEAITGQTPHEFPEPDSSAGNTGLWMIIDKVVRQNTIRKTEHTGELMDIAMKAMSSAPKERHASVIEFQESIKEFQTHEESRRLTERAHKSVSLAVPTSSKQGYQNYQTATALFEEASVAWPENRDARLGLRKARYDYALLAHTKGDYDLGLQVVAEEQGEDFQQLTTKLTRSRRFRNGLKKATLTAVTAIILVGTFATYQAFKINQQNNEITALYGDKESLEADKENLVKETEAATAEKLIAEKAKEQAETDRLVAEKAKAEADIAKRDALVQKEEAEAARLVADQLKQEAEMARLVAEKDKEEAKQQQMLAEIASEEAEQKRLVAEKEKDEAGRKLTMVNIAIELAEKEKLRADIAVTNSRIASRIRNADYPAALRSVEELLSSFETNEELAKLPRDERDKKIMELQAQKQQLEKRTRQTESPVQAQVISPSGRLVVWGDDHGKLTVWKLQEGTAQLSDAPSFTKQLDAPVSAIRISDDEQTVVAASGADLHVWIPAEQQFFTLTDHTSKVTTVTMDGQHLLSADNGGNIFGWDIKQRKQLWSIRSSSAIRDIVLLSDSRQFLYAGSRGGQSADVLAYALPPENDPTARPVRKGQLRLPRDRNNPPLRIAVSPDESLLIISNSRNGEVISLPRRPAAEFSGRDEFPFQHAVDLQQQGLTNWAKSKHQRPVNDIVFSADGKRLVTASDDRTVGVWNVEADGSLQFVQRLEGHGARVNSAGFLDASGNQVLSASADRFCRFWAVDTYDSERQEIERSFGLDEMESGFLNRSQRSRFSNNRILDSNSAQSRRSPVESRQWITTGLDSQDSQPNQEPDHIVVNANSKVQRGSLNTVVLSSDGRRLITGAADGTAVIWDTTTGRQIRGMSTRANYDSEKGSFDEGHAFNVARLRFLPPNGKVMITTGFDGTLCLWNADTTTSGAGRQEIRIPGLGLVNAIATSPDGQLIATSAGAEDKSQRSGSAMVWKTDSLLGDATPVPLATFSGFHRADVSALAVNHDSTLIATGARDGRVGVWSVATGQRIAGRQIHVKDTIVSHLEWMADNSFLSAGFDGRIQLVDIQQAEALSASDARDDADAETGRLIVRKTFEHDRIPVERIAFAPGGDRFVSISVRTDRKTKQISSELQLWDLAGSETARRIHPAIVAGKQPDRIVAIDWSHSGDRLAAVVDDNLQIFDTESWKITDVLDAPGLGISDAVFAPPTMSDKNPENIIATFDGTASHLWNLKDRSHIADFRPLFAIQSTELLQDSGTSLLLTGDRAIRIFQADEANETFGQTISKISDPHRGVVTSIRFSPVSTANAHQFVSSGADGSAALWNWDTTNKQATLVRWLRKGQHSIKSVAWNKTGDQILLAESSGTLHLVDTTQQDAAPLEFVVSPMEEVAISAAEFSSDGNFVAVAGKIVSSGESCGWVFDLSDVANPVVHCTINGGHEAGGIRGICFLPNSSYLVTAGTDGAALIWNWLPSRAAEGPLAAYEAYQLLSSDDPRAHLAAINSVAVSDSGLIATACEDGTAIIWQNPFRP